MPKVAIIRCDDSADACAGFKCFPALRERTGADPPRAARLSEL
jgi:hypothetical protein